LQEIFFIFFVKNQLFFFIDVKPTGDGGADEEQNAVEKVMAAIFTQ
jgi:hypothetical protein